MKKQIMILILALTFTITISGAVSAADTYDIGVNVTEQAMSDTNLGLNTSENNLVITTGSTAHLDDGSTTEDSVSGIVDTTSNLADGQAITYGSGNLLIVNDPNGALTYTFVSLASNGALRAQTYTVTGTSTSYTINHGNSVYIGPDMTESQWNYALQELGDNAYNIIVIANLWAAGAPTDLMATTYSTKTIDAGIMSNYAIIKQFAKNYPKGTDQTNYIFSNAGDLDDDAALYGIYDFTYELYAMTGGDPTKIGIMQYDSSSNTGVFILVQENDLTSQFTAETGISVVDGTLSEIQYNLWLFNLMKTNPAALYTVLETKSIDEAAYNYLWYDDTIGYGHGLDENYIAGLPDLTTTYDQSQSVIPITDYNAMYEVGKTVFQQAMIALGYTSEEEFVADIEAGIIGVIATPYYENYNDISLAGLLDGINYLGSFNIANLLTDTHPWNHAQGALKIIFFRIDSLDLVNSANTVFTKILITVTQTDTGYEYTTSAGTGPGYITLMPLAYSQGASWDFMRVFTRCGCPSRIMEDYLAARYGLEEYALNAGESYMILSIPLTTSSKTEIWSKMAAVRMGLFGVSPALGTYISSGASVNSADTATQYAEYILIKWNSATNTGTAALIQYDSEKAAELMAADGYTNRNYWILDKVFQDSSYLSAMFSVVREIPLTSNTLTELSAAGGDPVDYLLNYVVPTTEPTTPTTSDTSTTTTTATTTTGTALTTISGAVTSTWNSLTASTPTTSEIAPGLPLEQTAATGTATSTSDSTGTGTNSNLPVGAILGAIFLIVAALLIYLGRNTILATIKGYGRPGK